MFGRLWSDPLTRQKLEDIYAGLTIVRADMDARRKWPRGVRKPNAFKCYIGCGVVSLLLVVVLGPLLLFSSTSPFSQDRTLPTTCSLLLAACYWLLDTRY